MADGLPPDSQAAMACSCGDAVLPCAAAARLRALARLRAFARSAARRSCRASARAFFSLKCEAWRISGVVVVVAEATVFCVWLSFVAANGTAGAAAAEAASAGMRTFLTEALLVGCVVPPVPPPGGLRTERAQRATARFELHRT